MEFVLAHCRDIRLSNMPSGITSPASASHGLQSVHRRSCLLTSNPTTSSSAHPAVTFSFASSPTPSRPPTSRRPSSANQTPSRLPRDAAARTDNRAIELRRLPSAPGRDSHHALGSPPTLGCRFAHPGLNEAFCLQSIERGIEGPHGTPTTSCLLKRGPNCGAVRLVAKSGGN